MIERMRQLASAVSFHRGLAIGAMVGAAIAGSTIWSRVRLQLPRRGGRRAAAGAPGAPASRDANVAGTAETPSGADRATR